MSGRARRVPRWLKVKRAREAERKALTRAEREQIRRRTPAVLWIVVLAAAAAALGWSCYASRAHAAALPAWTLTGHAPLYKSLGCCCADSSRPARAGAVVLYHVGQQGPTWRQYGRVAIFDPVLWARVVAEGAPVQEQSIGVTDGQAFAFEVAPDTLSRFVLVRWPVWGASGPWMESRCWSRLVVRP